MQPYNQCQTYGVLKSISLLQFLKAVNFNAVHLLYALI